MEGHAVAWTMACLRRFSLAKLTLTLTLENEGTGYLNFSETLKVTAPSPSGTQNRRTDCLHIHRFLIQGRKGL